MAEKKYGLLLPKKNQLSAPKVGNVFGNDDDSEEEEGTDWVKKALKAENEKNKIKKQTRLNMQKALKEDPTIFQYDEVYDEIERAKDEEKKSVKNVERKPKYIQNLLKSADLRKKEQELRKERIIQKEIEEEEAMFPDKERFVTSSYKAKLEEMQIFEKEQENQDRLEAIGDVMKQKDMSGFYRHLYRQTVEKNEADLGIVTQPNKSDDKNKANTEELNSDIDKDDPIPSDSESEHSDKSECKKDTSKDSSIRKRKNKRQYRKRVEEASESESDHESEKDKNENVEGKKENVDEKNNDKLNDKDESETQTKKQKLSDKAENEKSAESSKPIDENQNPNEKTEKITPPSGNGDTKKAEEMPKPKKKKINIWQKRTVGPLFDAALERYLIRKEERLSGL